MIETYYCPNVYMESQIVAFYAGYFIFSVYFQDVLPWSIDKNKTLLEKPGFLKDRH